MNKKNKIICVGICIFLAIGSLSSLAYSETNEVSIHQGPSLGQLEKKAGEKPLSQMTQESLNGDWVLIKTFKPPYHAVDVCNSGFLPGKRLNRSSQVPVKSPKQAP